MGGDVAELVYITVPGTAGLVKFLTRLFVSDNRYRILSSIMSLKTQRLEKGGRSASDKDKVKLSRSRDSQQDLRSVLSKKERKDREESRERRPRARDRIRHSSGDLRDRLDKYRDSDYRANLNCGDLSQGKSNLLSMFLEDNPCKDFKG